MGDPISTSRGRSTNSGIKDRNTSLCKNEDLGFDEKSFKISAELYKSSGSDPSTITKKYVEKCHLPKKRFSYIYSQSEKLASSSKASTSVNNKSSTENDLVKDHREARNVLDSSYLSASNVKYTENSSKPEEHHSSVYSKKCQPPKKRYSYLYSQTEVPSKTCLKSTSSNEFPHGLSFGDLSLVESNKKSVELYDSFYLDQSDKQSKFVGTYQIPENQYNYLSSHSEDASSNKSNIDTEYAQGLSSQSFSYVVPANSVGELHEINPLKQFAGIKIYAEKWQIPGNPNIYLYSQSKDGSSFSGKSHTVLLSNLNTQYSHGLSSGSLALVESVKNTEEVKDTCALDLSTGRKKSDEYQLPENPLSSSFCQKEALPSSTKTYRALDLSGNGCPGRSGGNESEMIYLKDLTDAEREERRKELSKRRSEKYRLNCQEKMKQLDEEYHTLQEKNKTLHAKFDNLKYQWDKLLTISPCFAGKCESFKPLNEIKKSLGVSGTDLKEDVESDEEDANQTSKCKCKGHMKCETNKCSCYKKLISCTPRCHKNYSCRNH